MHVSGKIIVDHIIYNVEGYSNRKPSKFGINGGKVTTLWITKHKEGLDPDAIYTVRPIIDYKHGEWRTPEPQEGTHAYEVLQTALSGIEVYLEARKPL